MTSVQIHCSHNANKRFPEEKYFCFYNTIAMMQQSLNNYFVYPAGVRHSTVLDLTAARYAIFPPMFVEWVLYSRVTSRGAIITHVTTVPCRRQTIRRRQRVVVVFRQATCVKLRVSNDDEWTIKIAVYGSSIITIRWPTLIMPSVTCNGTGELLFVRTLISWPDVRGISQHFFSHLIRFQIPSRARNVLALQF